MNRMICELDAEGQSLIWRAGDLKARFMLLNRAEWLYKHGHPYASCTLIHAMKYLEDRLAYELFPWPKDHIRISVAKDENAARNGGQDAR